MTYSAVYCALISKRLQHPLDKKDCYCERHHIIPKSEGGKDEPDNLVNLTAREHYIAHLLLMKIYNDWKMKHAFTMMAYGNSGQNRGRVSSRLFEKYKYQGNGRLGCKHKPETIEKMRLAATGKHWTEEQRRKMKEYWERRAALRPVKKKKQICKAVSQYTITGELVATYQSQTQAAKALGVTSPAIVMCCRGVRKTCLGYVFRYVGE